LRGIRLPEIGKANCAQLFPSALSGLPVRISGKMLKKKAAIVEEENGKGTSQKFAVSVVPLGLWAFFARGPAAKTAGYSQKSFRDKSSVPKGQIFPPESHPPNGWQIPKTTSGIGER
jgi:hypothetical protein